MVKVSVNNNELEVGNGLTIIQACEQAGVEIPRFCYHEKLAIAGNCRMCLVEVEGAPKLVASCAMPATEGMKIRTDTEKVKTAREAVMEFLLINHPLDCPICDQGGECDLQDQALFYGKGVSAYREKKRSVKDKYLGPLIATHMTRCIHCTRCVRFLADLAGTCELGSVWRGEDMEIINKIDQSIHSEVSGNIIDLCPVGALTSKPSASTYRPWELKKTRSIDVNDAMGSNIEIHSRGREVLRIVPRSNDEINEDWISDKARFSFDGLKKQRIDQPYLRENGKLIPISWTRARQEAAHQLQKRKKIAALSGDLVDCGSIYALKRLFHELGSHNLDCRNGSDLDFSNRYFYLFNSTFVGVDRADSCLLIGVNPRVEAAVLNVRMRQRFLQGGFQVANLGPVVNLTYPSLQLGDNIEALHNILSGSHPFSLTLQQSKFPLIIVGQDALSRPDCREILRLSLDIAEKYGQDSQRQDWSSFNVLHRSAGRVGALDLGFVPKEGGMGHVQIIEASERGELELLYLLGVENLDFNRMHPNTYIIYQGHHGDVGASYANLVLPGSAYSEKDGFYINNEGRVQEAKKAVDPPGEAQEDMQIIIALAAELGFDFSHLPSNLREELSNITKPRAARISSSCGNLIKELPIRLSDESFYTTNSICRASQVMLNCVKEIDLRRPKALRLA